MEIYPPVCVAKGLNRIEVLTMGVEFRCWVLEWPAKAVFACIWPGLRNNHNHFGCILEPNNLPTNLNIVRFDKGSDKGAWALKVWDDLFSVGPMWLVLDKTEPRFYGRTFNAEGQSWVNSEGINCYEGRSWIQWLRTLSLGL
jgi:hypothetical protein